MCPPIELADLDILMESLLSVKEDFGCFNDPNWDEGAFGTFGTCPWLVPGRSFAVLPALERAPKFGFPRLGVGERAPIREPIADPDLGVVGGSRLGRGFWSPGVTPLRTGLSDRPDKDGRPPGAFMALPKARPAGDSERLRPGVLEGGASEETPVGEGRSRTVGVGGACEESVEFRLLARARGTKMPDSGCAVVKYRILRENT
jgi:hypothetical protein